MKPKQAQFDLTIVANSSVAIPFSESNPKHIQLYYGHLPEKTLDGIVLPDAKSVGNMQELEYQGKFPILCSSIIDERYKKIHFQVSNNRVLALLNVIDSEFLDTSNPANLNELNALHSALQNIEQKPDAFVLFAHIRPEKLGLIAEYFPFLGLIVQRGEGKSTSKNGIPVRYLGNNNVHLSIRLFDDSPSISGDCTNEDGNCFRWEEVQNF